MKGGLVRRKDAQVDKARRDHLPLRIDPLRVRRHGDVPGRDDAIAFDQDGAGEQRIPRRIGQATVDDGEFSHREIPLKRSP